MEVARREPAGAKRVAEGAVLRVADERFAEDLQRLFDTRPQRAERPRAFLVGDFGPLFEPTGFRVAVGLRREAGGVGHQPQQREVGEQFAREHRLEIKFQIRLPGQRLAVAEDAEPQAVGDDAPEVAGAAVEEFLHQPVRIGGGGPADARRPPVEIDAAADQVDGGGTEEAIDGVGAALELGADAGRQQAEAEFPEQRDAPFVVGQAGARFVGRQVAGRRAEFGPVAPHAVPRLRDRLVDPLAGRQAVVGGGDAGEFSLGIDGAAEQVGRQQAALGVDRLEFGSGLRHG